MNRPLIPIVLALASTAALADQPKPASGAPGTLRLGPADRPVLVYQAAHLDSPIPDAPWYGRSGFIHPVYTPSGRVVTDDFPKNHHHHQHGLMFAWTSARIDGRKVDFWNSQQRQGRVEHVDTVQADADTIVVKLRHVDLTAKEPAVVLHETWRVTRVPHEGMNVFDLESTQTCATDTPIEIAQYHYGAMSVRGSGRWIDGPFKMLTSEGKTQTNGNHTRPKWVAMYGDVDGGVCGIAGMSHPSNLHSPQAVRLHPEMPYFCFAPMVTGAFTIKAGEPYVSRYRFVAFDGEPNAEALGALRRSFDGADELVDPVIKVGGKPVAQYRTEPTTPPDGVPEYFARSGCLHPVYSPSGKVVTGDSPADHRHHHGIMSSYIRTRFDGRTPNFWDMGDDRSRVEHVSARMDGDALVAEQRYVDVTAEGEPVTALRESWRIEPRPGLGEDVLVFDLALTQTCATDKPLVIEEFRIGGVLLRGSNEWTNKRFTLVTSEGKDQTNGNHTRPKWTAMSGEVDGETCGVAILDHPSNFRHPQPVRVVPTQPYAVMSPMVPGELAIEPGKPYTARYRFVTFDGEPDAERLNALWADFAGAAAGRE